MSTILLRTLDERFSQGDIRTQGNHIIVEEINIEPKIMIFHHLQIHIIEGSTKHQGTI
jgi:hypothetical protein